MSSLDESKDRVDEALAAQLGPADEDYRKALERVAREAGLRPDELQKRLRKTADALEPSGQCLTLAELEAFPELPTSRAAHVDKCNFCQALLRAVEAPPIEVRHFVEDAIQTQAKNRREWMNRWVPRFAGAFTAVMMGLVGLAVLPRFVARLDSRFTSMPYIKLDPNMERWYQDEYRRVEAALRHEPSELELLLRKSEILILLDRDAEARQALEKAKVAAGKNSDEAVRYEKLLQASQATHSLISTKSSP